VPDSPSALCLMPSYCTSLNASKCAVNIQNRTFKSCFITMSYFVIRIPV
jgi:hypothetical protein